MAATSFNGVTASIDTQAVLITSIDFSGGDTALVDVTASTDAFRQNIAGIRSPFTVTLNGHSETGYLPDAGDTTSIIIANGHWLGRTEESPQRQVSQVRLTRRLSSA